MDLLNKRIVLALALSMGTALAGCASSGDGSNPARSGTNEPSDATGASSGETRGMGGSGSSSGSQSSSQPPETGSGSTK